MTVQNCAECGTRAEPGQSFCDACGAVLGWNRSGSAAPAPAAAPPATSAGSSGAPGGAASASDGSPGWNAFDRPGPGGTGLAPARRTGPAGGAQPHTADAPQAPEGAAREHRPADPAAPEHRSPEPGHRAAPHTAAPEGNSSVAAPHGMPLDREDDDTVPRDPVPAYDPPAPTAHTAPPASSAHSAPQVSADRARSLLVPVDDPGPARDAPPAVAPVLPGRPDAERPHVRTPVPPLHTEDGPPCRWCATPNRVDRHFCARCAMPLAQETATTAPGRLPWWRRLLGRGQRDVPWAGDRPPLRRVLDRIGTWIGVLVALALVALAIVFLPDGIRATSDHFAKRAPVSPDNIKASHEFPGHPAKLVIDKRSNTWWGPGVTESGQGEWVEVGFTEPTRLLDVIITPGVSKRPEKINESALPHRVLVTLTGADGKTTTRNLTLDQGAGPQRRPFRVGEVTKVRFTVQSAHAASAEKQVALAEIELFGPSSASRF
ncbi:zinc ribbon domain-containing protein [Streptomyces sp. NPDC004111]|uniref:NADase-type glycan-binding domain-containing protein n=1 Tax=Streptomyces sp. NPDC004111 TaxID=3364690 RepID=UPI00368E33B8